MTPTLVNTCARPVELHLPAGTVVLPPYGELACSADDLAVGQVVALRRSSVLDVREQQDEPPEPPPSEPVKRRSRSTRRLPPRP
jgi:hypothetical protein